MNAHIIENTKTEKFENSDKENLNSLLDLMGKVDGGINQEEFQEIKEQILDSGITTEGMLSLLGNSVAEVITSRPIADVAIQILTDTAIVPEYSHVTDACADIYADEDVVIEPGKTSLISTGFALAIPNGYVVHIYPRSGLSAKTNLRLANSVGVIDAGYRDEVKVPLWNAGDSPCKIEKGMRIAQMSIDQSPAIEFHEVEDVKIIPGDRLGGFGSTGLFDLLNEDVE
jgi:dUTP pyrophosphatase